MKITNNHNISLPLAVWLMFDEYDYNPDPSYISATSLLKSTKQLILSKRVLAADLEMDISEKIASSFGTAIHDSVEKAWRLAASPIMKRLGYPNEIADNIVVNPTDEYMATKPNTIPIYFEKRVVKEIKEFKIGGKFDTIIDGHLFDFKTTSTFSYTSGNKDEDYALQGSIYRWLNPELVTDPYIYINFVFTDWQKFRVLSDRNYPKLKLLEHPVPLLSMEDTEKYIVSKLEDYVKYFNEPEANIPPCTDKELWRSEPQYKYYLDPTKATTPGAKSTKNCDTLAEANEYMASKGGKGIIKTVPGEVKACAYCAAYSVCEQRKSYDV